MAGRGVTTAHALITDAALPTSLSTDQRASRYLWSMLVRVLCFLGGIVAPMPWNFVLFAGAALLPGIAVLFGNAKDNRRPAPILPEEHHAVPMLTPGDVIRGEVVEEHPA